MKMLLLAIGALICIGAAVYVLEASSTTEGYRSQIESEREVPLEQVPAAVRATILREAGPNPVHEIEFVVARGRSFYEADWVADGAEIEIMVDAEGQILGRGAGELEDEGNFEGAEDREDSEDR